MSEEKEKLSYMQQLDQWTEANVIVPLAEAANCQFHPGLADQIKKALRIKMLQSFRNGQAIGPKPADFSNRKSGGFTRKPQEGGPKAYVR